MDNTAIGPLVLTIVAALIAGVPPTLAALAAYKQSMASLATAEQTQAIARKIAEDAVVSAKEIHQVAQRQAIQTGQLIGKVDEVHTLTNSNLAQVRAELAQASQRIESLLAVVTELKTERGKSQIREALHTKVPDDGGNRRADDPTAKQQLDVQKEIAANTEETAQNTAKPAS